MAMSPVSRASIFIPESLLLIPDGWLLGWWITEPNVVVYVLAILHSSEPANDRLFDRCFTPEGQVGFMPVVLGKFKNMDVKRRKPVDDDAVAMPKKRSALSFRLRVCKSKLELEDFIYENERVNVQDCCKIFLYETSVFLSSELLISKTNKDMKQLIFVKEDFALNSCVEKLLVVLHQWRQFRFFEIPEVSDTVRAAKVFSRIDSRDAKAKDENDRSYLRKLCWKMLFCSAFFRQLYQRFRQVIYVLHLNETEQVFQKSLRCQNVFLSVVVDVALGIFLLHRLLELFSPGQLLELFMLAANFVVDHLQELLHWLMGVPAGLKLNYPFNSALGHFFLYHIYLWKTYITVVKPLLQYMLKAITLLGWLGISFQMSLFSDLMSLATFHVYCFYVYAARLYHLHLAGLISLWRLVRGRKSNPLRHRVDSCTYTTDQLFLGTITFMILLFLMPTTFLYYCVFSSLRLSSLAVLGLLHHAIYIINTVPFYAIILFFKRSNLVAGEITFTVISGNETKQPATLMLKNSISSLKNIWSLTQPTDFVPKSKTSWGSFMKNLLLGRLIYPF